MPWNAALAAEGKAYQVRLGTVTSPVTGDVDITDTAAEAGVDAATGWVIIPIYLNASLESLNGGTLPQISFKTVNAVTTSGTAFVPLNLKLGGPLATNVARVQVAGNVAVAAELNTTTRDIFSNTLVIAASSKPWADEVFETPPVIFGPGSAYLQAGGPGFGPIYFAHFDYIELLAREIS
jgi:hypothetical protein